MISSPVKLLAAAVCLLAITGCATKPALYQWGGYDDLLFQSYKSPDRAEAMRIGLEAHLAALQTTKQRIPPGLYAEIGTLYLEKGNQAIAVSYYKKERETWAESKTLMDSMIKTLESKQTGASQ